MQSEWWNNGPLPYRDLQVAFALATAQSQCNCRSCGSRKSVENTLGAAELRGVSPEEELGIVMSSHSILSRVVSGRSRDRQELLVVNCGSDVSMGE